MHLGLLDVGANMLRFRAPSNLPQRWNESLIAPFEQLHDSRDFGRVRIEVIALIRVLIGQMVQTCPTADPYGMCGSAR